MSTQISKTTYTCKFCHKVYVREAAYMAHECKQMKRDAEFKTPNGQTAWNYYQVWMKHKNRIPPSTAAFLTSNYFRTFMNFVKFTKQVKLPQPEKFIRLMVQRDYPPTMWTNDEVYSQYIEFLDSTADPFDQVAISIDTLLEYADNKDIDVSDIFEAINPNELLQMIRIRRVSPWLLLGSRKFIQFFQTMNTEQQSIIETLINPDKWGNKKSEQAEKMVAIKRIVQELGI